MSAYGLPERERDVTRLVLHGSSTAEIAAALFSHYEPRLRDNEEPATHRKPLRGGPAVTTTRPATGGSVRA